MRYLALLLALGLVGGCTQGTTGEGTTPAKSATQPATPGEIGARYLREHYPDWAKDEADSHHPEVLLDRGTYWEYTFELPANVIGGVPVVEIDKQTLKVLKAYHTQ